MKTEKQIREWLASLEIQMAACQKHDLNDVMSYYKLEGMIHALRLVLNG